VSNFKLPITDDSTALQTFEFTLPGPPTDPSRQDAPHPHETFLDPTGAYVLSPDLGSDLIHIFAIDKASGKLNQCDAFAVKGGNGPRHGAWWAKPGNSGGDSTAYALYISNELANTVSIYKASYKDNCLVLDESDEIVPYPKDVPSTANVAEVRIAGDRDVYVSVRNDQAFPPNDSMAFLQASVDDSTLTYTNLTTSYGKTPRTFVINNAGTLLAIGNQASSDVAIVARDPKTGALGELVAQLQVGAQGTPGQSDGLSSVIWAE
jgi:6-phosphogluconolactonase (cycloisomerase 2 family)